MNSFGYNHWLLSWFQEILRVHGRAARALANQSLPYSVCTFLRDEEIYTPIDPQQEEKNRDIRCQFHQRFYVQIFRISVAFSSYVLALAKNLYEKCARKNFDETDTGSNIADYNGYVLPLMLEMKYLYRSPLYSQKRCAKPKVSRCTRFNYIWRRFLWIELNNLWLRAFTVIFTLQIK